VKRRLVPIGLFVALLVSFWPATRARAATVGYWRFEEGSGTTVDDSSVNNNVGTLLNGALFSTEAPVFGPANSSSLDLDGSNDTMEVPDAAALDITGAFTLEAFIRPGVASEPLAAGIVLRRNLAGNGVAYGIFVGSSNNRVRAQIQSIGTATSDALAANQWHHVAAVFTGSVLRFYADYRLVDSVAVAGPIETSSNPLVVGAFSQFFDGLIDEVRLSNVALSPGQFLGGIFSDGFESGNTSAWSSAVP